MSKEVRIEIAIIDQFASEADKAKAEEIAEQIKRKRIGKVIDIGSGEGIQEIYVDVDGEEKVEQIRTLIGELGMLQQTNIDSYDPDDEDED